MGEGKEMTDFGQLTLKEIIYTAGWLEGIWIAFGVNPDKILFDSLAKVVVSLGAGPGSVLLLKLLPLLLLVLSVVIAYHLGGKLGLIAIGVAFIGGLLVNVAPIVCVLLLFMGLALGAFAEGT